MSSLKFLFKYPTFRRPDWFMQTLEKYYSMLSGQHQYHFLITLNEEDETMHNDKMIIFMRRFPNLVCRYGKHKTKIEACNADMDGEDFDILFLISDDMIPVVPGFDIIIAEEMKSHFPDMDGALHFPDGYNNKDENSAITLSIMGKKLYDRFGYIYHPDYKSFYCDNEFKEVVYKMDKVVFIPKVIVRHDWRGIHHDRPDDVYKQNSVIGSVDEATYNRRKIKEFPK